jgi:carbon-monoxide dehydrogenase medium subunit
MARNATIERGAVARSHPILAEALHEVAHPQIRDRGTLGGNLCRCAGCRHIVDAVLVAARRMRG